MEIRSFVLGTLVFLVYAMQGMFYGVIEEFLPPILNRQSDNMQLARALTLARIPFALKFFIAPLVDAYAKGIIGHSGWLIATASVILPILNHLWTTIDVNVAQNTISGANTIYPLILVACATAVSDVVVDVFALPLRSRALLQILGMLLGRLIPATVSFLLSWDVNCVSCPFFLMLVAGALQIVGLFIWRLFFSVDEPINPESRATPSVLSVLAQTRDFIFYRKNMFWWLLHQLIPPMAYFHLISILPSRMQNYRGFELGNVAQWDLILFFPVVALVVWANFRLQGDLVQFAKLYFLQACFSLALVGLYTVLPWSPGGKGASYAAEASYGVAMRIQDTLFYMFELGEFNFYGQVAELQPAIAATIVAFQASMFNLAEFLHPNLAIWIVDSTSSCANDFCLFDTYPLVGLILTCCGVGVFFFLWKPLKSYSNINDAGWKQSDRIQLKNVVLFCFLALLTVTALVSGTWAAATSATAV